MNKYNNSRHTSPARRKDTVTVSSTSGVDSAIKGVRRESTLVKGVNQKARPAQFDFNADVVVYNPNSESREDSINPPIHCEDTQEFDVVQISTDGNCLYNSVATCLNILRLTGPKIKQDVLNFIEENPEFLLDDPTSLIGTPSSPVSYWAWLQEIFEEVNNDYPASTFAEFIKLTRLNNKFASNLQIAIICHLYKVDVQVFIPDEGNQIKCSTKHKHSTTVGSDLLFPRLTVHIIRLHGNHYVAAIPKISRLEARREHLGSLKGVRNSYKTTRDINIISDQQSSNCSLQQNVHLLKTEGWLYVAGTKNPVTNNQIVPLLPDQELGSYEYWMNGKREETRVKGFKKKNLGNQMPPPSLRPPTPKKKKDSVIIDLSNLGATKGHKDSRSNNKRKKSERQHPKRSSTLKDLTAREQKGNNRNRGENAGSNGAYNFSSRREFPELPPNDETARSVCTLPTKEVSNGSGSERVNNTVRPSNIGHLLQNPQGNHIRFGSYISALTSSGGVGEGVGINSGSSQVCDERNEFPLDRPNQGHSTHNIIDNYLTKTLCIWNLELHLVPDVWSLMRRVLRDSTYNGIIQIRRICQKNHRIRFEIDSKSETFDSFYRELKSRYIYRSCAWKVHIKDFTKGRKVAQMKAVTPELGAHAPLVLASYNVNSLVKKRLEVEEYIEENKVDILFLQETKKKADHWRTHLHGFNVIEKVMDASTVGAKGIALAVRNGITAFPVGESSPYFITLRLFGRDIIQPVIVICVYIPHSKAICRGKADYKAKGRVLKQLATNVNNCAAKFPQDAIVVGGDLNTISKSLGKFLRKTDMSLCEFTGDARTCTKGDNGLPIDHFIVSSEHKALVTDVHVDTSLELSDHFPIRANLHLRRRVPDSDGFVKPPKWKVPRTRLVPENVVIDHNYWQELYNEEIEQPADATGQLESPRTKITRMGLEFRDTCNKIGKQVGYLNNQGIPKQKYISKNYRSAVMEKRRIFCILKAIDKVNQPREHRKFQRAMLAQRKVVHSIAREERKLSWSKSIVKYDDYDPEDLKSNWKWILQTSGWRRKARSDTLQPMRDEHNVLHLEGEKVREIWKNHFGKLAEDETGHSQSKNYWEHLFPPVDDFTLRPTIQSLNEDITRPELVTALRFMKLDKAPGPDAIPVDFFMHFLTFQKAPPEEVPDLDMIQGSVALNKLFELIQLIWKEGCVPSEMNLAILVAILKKGDPTKCGNYRGISLMDSVIKVLISTLTLRLTNAMESEGLISRAQGGFRRREECASQCVALYEIIKRRMNVALPTYTLFLDLQKAYDTVPHQALFVKLDRLGVRGRFALFLVGLYEDSQVVVKTNDGARSDPFPLRRGLRQGCPMSPILFDMFINDIFDDCGGEGVRIPYRIYKGLLKDGSGGYLKLNETGTTRRKLRESLRIAGLLFADDAVCLAGTEKELYAIKLKVIAWADKHDMTFGVPKCGLLRFQDAETILQLKGKVLSQAFVSHDWTINGISIPTPEYYKYLGLEFYIDLDLDKMSMSRLRLGRAALKSISPFLKCPTIPVRMKVKLLRACIISTMAYGAEVWGFSEHRTIKMDVVINNAARMIMGIKIAQQCSVGAIRAELCIPSMYSIASVARTRAFIKFRTLKTWISHLMQYPLKGRKKTWISATEYWLKRYALIDVNALGRAERAAFLLGGKSSLRYVCDIVNEKVKTKSVKSAPLLGPYFSCKFKRLFKSMPAEIRGVNGDCVYIPYFAPGMILLSIFRANGYMTEVKRIKMGIGEKDEEGNVIDTWNDQSCPFCKKKRFEGRRHILFGCKAWRNLREKFLGPILSSLTTEYNVRLGSNSSMTLLLGGTLTITKGDADISVALGGYYPWQGESPTTSQRMSASYSENREEGINPLWASRICYRVAGYLAAVHRERIIILKGLKTRATAQLPRAPQEHAYSAEDQEDCG